MNRLQIVPKTTFTSATQTSGVSIATVGGGADYNGDWTLVLEVLNQTAGAQSRIVFEDSTNNFTAYNVDIFSGPGVDVVGAVGASGQESDVVRFCWRARDFEDLRVGVLDAQLRVNLARLEGTNPSIVLQSWIEW